MPTFKSFPLFSTYSIVARDPATGQLGGAVQTHQMGVGRVIPFALPGVGVVASQSLANVKFNPLALMMLKQGIGPQPIINGLVASDPDANRRQVAVINAQGEAAAFSGAGCIREFGHYVGNGYSVQANMMTRPTVIDAMREAFEGADGDLAARMLAALEAAQAEDGDIRGMQSAAMKVVPGQRDVPEWTTTYDLRVDENDHPVEELARLVRIRRAELVSDLGEENLRAGRAQEAMRLWAEARALAPDQEEVGFWQAVTLADAQPDAIQEAAGIFEESAGKDARRAQWLDLIGRLEECGLIERRGAGDKLLRAISELAARN